MRIGVPKETKNHEYRVGLNLASVAELVHHGHEVWVEAGAGVGIGILDSQYETVGGKISQTAKDIFEHSELIVKVKEPQPDECAILSPKQILFTYLHLAPDPIQAQTLLQSGCSAIAYETITDRKGRLPLLAPSSAVAGRMAIQVGAHCLEKAQGGSGILLGGVSGVAPARVLVLGGGVAGTEAIQMALGLGADVTVLDTSLQRLQELDFQFSGTKLKTIFSTRLAIESYVPQADLLVGAVLLPGAAAPKLVSSAWMGSMKRGSVAVDLAIDQGGCFETSKPTTHANPTYVSEGVVHYCVTNMPGAVACTSTHALNNATLPYVLTLANQGLSRALRADSDFRAGLNVYRGQITHPAVAQALGMSYVEPLTLL